MRCKACLSIIIALVFFATSANAQTSIAGLWKGTLFHDTTQKWLSYEIAINEDTKGKLSGYSHTWFLFDDNQVYYGVKDIKVKQAKDGKIIVEDEELIANNYPQKPPKGIRAIYVLDLIETADSLILDGNFETNITKEYRKATGKVHLAKRIDFKQSALIPHLQELGLENKLTFLKQEEETYTAKEDRKIEDIKQVSAATKTEIKPSVAAAPAIKQPEMPELRKEEPVIAIKETPAPKPAGKPVQPAIQDPMPAAVVTKQPEKPKPAPVIATAPKPQPQPSKPQPVAVVTKQQEQPKPAPAVAAVPKPQPKQNDYVASANAARNIAERKIETVQSLYFVNDSLEITLYDNGEVDGDTVSVLMNGKIILANQGLSTRAIKKVIYTSEIKDSIQLIMYAENLGAIAPNTGLMIVNDGNRRHEIRFSGDLQKSSAIVFRRKE